jgi:two-component system alkaline phosphatase synthesis response regulator PhoP/two-component system response regulator VicR
MKKIMIIEDEDNLIELLKVNLMAEGFSVSVASNGIEGLKRTEDERPDAVILDVRLPLMDGWKVCQRLKENAKTKSIPIIILTAASQKSDAAEAKRVGCDLFLTKPFDPIELVKIVKQIITAKV